MVGTLDGAERHRPVAPILRASARAIPDVLCVLGHFSRSFFEGSCLPEIDTAETSDGIVPPLSAELAPTTVLSSFAFFCYSDVQRILSQLSLRPPLCCHLSLSFAVVMFSASFVALTTSLQFHTFISSAAHSRPFVLCSSAATRRVRRVTETVFATFQYETTFDARERCMQFVAGCGWPREMPLRKTTAP